MIPKKIFYNIIWLIYKYLLRKKEIIVPILNSKMVLDTINNGISKSLMINRIREKDHTQIIMEALKPGMNILEIGANIGYYVLIEASKIGPTGKIYAFEPDKRNTRILKKNLLINHIEQQVMIFEKGMSNKVGYAHFQLSQKTNLNSFIADQNQTSYLSLNTAIVETTTIDYFVSDLNVKIDFIRMDVEGSEVEILQAAIKALQMMPLGFTILLELHPYTYSDTHSFEEILRKLYYLGFESELIVSAGNSIPKIYQELGYKPERIVESDGFHRGFFRNITIDDSCKLCMNKPKVARYILLEKKY